MNKIKQLLCILIFCLALSGCGGLSNKNDTEELPKTPSEEQASERFAPEPTQTTQNADQSPTITPQNISFRQNKYTQFMLKLKPSIAEMDELFYCEIDADEDGRIEIIASFGYKSKGTYDVDLIEADFVLRDKNGAIQLVEQDFCSEGGYEHSYMQLVQFTGSTRYYIAVGVTNTANMNGLAIYEVTDDAVQYLDGAQSPVGVCDVYLSDKKSDGTYGGFTAEFSSYDVLYYSVSTFYKFNDGIFRQRDSKVDVRDYPKTPTNVVVQYLSLECLRQRYFSYDIVKRSQEIYDGWLGVHIGGADWDSAIYCYELGVDLPDYPHMTVSETGDGQTAKVDVNLSDIQNEELRTIIFDLVFRDGKWRISSAKETVSIGSDDRYVKFTTFNVNKRYDEAGGFAELDLKLPELTGSYEGIAAINMFFIDKENFFFSEIDLEPLKSAEMLANSIKGKESNWYRSAYYSFEAKIGDIISISASLDGGMGGVGWAGIEGDTFDLNTGKKLVLSDIFKVSEDEYLDFIYDFVANIVFYQKYALADGASGPQVFEIPYDAILNILAIDIK